MRRLALAAVLTALGLVSLPAAASAHNPFGHACTPQDGVRIQIATVLHYQGLVTRDNGSFTRLVDLWSATLDAIEGAYGSPPAGNARAKR